VKARRRCQQKRGRSEVCYSTPLRAFKLALSNDVFRTIVLKKGLSG
jgi:hypothetical protein